MQLCANVNALLMNASDISISCTIETLLLWFWPTILHYYIIYYTIYYIIIYHTICWKNLMRRFYTVIQICACPPGMELSNDNRTCINQYECFNKYKCSEHRLCIQKEKLYVQSVFFTH